METRVLVTARRFEDLGVVANDGDRLAPIDQVDALAATPAAPELIDTDENAEAD